MANPPPGSPEFMKQVMEEFNRLRSLNPDEHADAIMQMQIQDNEDRIKTFDEEKRKTDRKNLITVEEKAKKYFSQGKYHEAMLCFQASLNMDPKDPKHNNNLAEVNLRLRKWSLAEISASRALALDKGNVKAMFRRAKARKMLGDLFGAAKDLTAVRNALPDDSSVLSEVEHVEKLQKLTSAQLVAWRASIPGPPPNLGDAETTSLMQELRTYCLT